MYHPVFRAKRNSVPIVSKKDLDYIGERLVGDFCPKAMLQPTEIDIDRFVERYLGMKLDYQYLSHCGCYLGMTVFNDTDKVPIYNPERNRAEYMSASAGTLLVDSSLLEESQEHRYRFTVGHEGGHQVLHAGYFGYDPNQISFLDDRAPMVQCRIDTRNAPRKPVREWTDQDTMEWQANYIASAVLMPERMVARVVDKVQQGNYAEMILLVSEAFNVSLEAAQIRLKDMGFIPPHIDISKAALDFCDFFDSTRETTEPATQ